MSEPAEYRGSAEKEAAHIVVGGHLCLDIIPGFPMTEVNPRSTAAAMNPRSTAAAMNPRSTAAAGKRDLFRPGSLSMVGAPVLSTGGAVSNVGLSLHRLGLPVRLVARIGSDPFGGIILERINGMGRDLARGISSVEGETTSYTVVLNPPGIDRIFFHCPGTNDTFTERDVPDSVLKGSSIFHFGYPPLMEKMYSDGGDRLVRILGRAREHGAITSLDMSLPDPQSASGRVDWSALLSRVLPHVDFFVPSVEEFIFMADRPAFDAMVARGGGEAIIRDITFSSLAGLAQKAISWGASVVLIKMGERGAYLRTGGRRIRGLSGWLNRELYTPVFSVPSVAGTTGAGDATIAGLLASVHRRLSPEEALTMAVAVGGCCVEAPDATSGVRPWEETAARIRAGWKRAEPVPYPPEWKSAGAGMLRGPADA